MVPRSLNCHFLLLFLPFFQGTSTLSFWSKLKQICIYLLVMPKYWVKNYFAHGRFHEVGQKQKTEGKKEERERERLNDGSYNGQATHGARKHAWRTQAAWVKKCVIEVGYPGTPMRILYCTVIRTICSCFLFLFFFVPEAPVPVS